MSDNGEKIDSTISRRNFLKILGAAPVVGAVGCTDDNRQKIFPYVKGEDSQVPGVSVWYRSTCTECSAGCGIEVRTREGRALKVEGSKEHPVNRGGLCAIGQSSLQHLYDPDRVREPLQKYVDDNGKTQWKTVSWDAAYKLVGEKLAKAKGKKYLISNSKTGAINELISEVGKSIGLEAAYYEAIDQSDIAKANELVFGKFAIPHYAFDQADVVLSFGADFLETWISPCEFARDWSSRRKSKNPSRVIHIEPRLSLTGGNADLWICSKPGSEVEIARAVLKLLVDQGKGRDVAGIDKLVAGASVAGAAAASGVASEKILLIAQYLAEAKSSLVISGGPGAGTNNALALHLVTAAINAVLGNVGKTIDFSKSRVPNTSVSKLQQIIEKLKAREVGVVFVHGANPAYSLPTSFGFKHAIGNAGLVVSLSSHLDETAALADVILPTHTSLESWGDVRVKAGIYSLLQPAMTPVFNTQSLGDVLLTLAKGQSKEVAGVVNFEEYLKKSWEKLKGELGVSEDFNTFWRKAVERGGYFTDPKAGSAVTFSLSAVATKAAGRDSEFNDRDIANEKSLVFLPYPSVRSFDGSSANRPWLQELPDPVTKIVWDYWAEIHPDTAKDFGLAQGDMVTIRNYYGEINVPAYLTEYVHRDVVAVPLGLGHHEYGRFAQAVGGGNAFDLLPPITADGTENLSLMSARAAVKRAPGRAVLVNTQGSDSQHGRDLARMKTVDAEESHAEHNQHGEHSTEHGHAEVKQMYEQRKHPFYKWAMVVDLAACTGCSACVVACYAENNIPVVGKHRCKQGREMSWLRIERYYEGPAEELKVSYLPMMCQQCGNAPCEPVCPVFATYHNEEGLNVMAYNRCVGTRYCGNNCSYKVRRFNWFDFSWPEPLDMQLNPDVVKRTMGVIEKCTFCIQRISEGKDHAKDLGRAVNDGDIQPACVQSCPTQALTFGNINDPESRVAKLSHDKRGYKVLDHHLNTQPAVTYLEDIRVKV